MQYQLIIIVYAILIVLYPPVFIFHSPPLVGYGWMFPGDYYKCKADLVLHEDTIVRKVHQLTFLLDNPRTKRKGTAGPKNHH